MHMSFKLTCENEDEGSDLISKAGYKAYIQTPLINALKLISLPDINKIKLLSLYKKNFWKKATKISDIYV